MTPYLSSLLSSEDCLERGLPLPVPPLQHEQTMYGECDFCEQEDLDVPPRRCTLWPSSSAGLWVCASHRAEEDASSSDSGD